MPNASPHSSELDDVLAMLDRAVQGDATGSEVGHSMASMCRHFIAPQLTSALAPATASAAQQDYLKGVAARVAVLEAQLEEDSEDMAVLRTAYQEILMEIVERLEEQFHFDCSERGGPSLEAFDWDRVRRVAEALYNFFVVKRVENALLYIKSAVLAGRRDFARDYRAKLENRRNLSMSGLKAQLKNFDDVIVCFFLGEIISDICTTRTDLSDFTGVLAHLLGGEIALEEVRDLLDPENSRVVERYLHPLVETPEMLQFTLARAQILIMSEMEKKEVPSV